MPTEPPDITQALKAYSPENEVAKNHLFNVLNNRLQDRANKVLRKFPKAETISPEDLVAELYIRLSRRDNLDFEDRTNFFRYASRIMYNILIDHMRKARKKVIHIDAEEHLGLKAFETPEEVIALRECIDQLYRLSERKKDVINLGDLLDQRIFIGLSREEMADHYSVNVRTITRHYNKAKALLRTMLESQINQGPK